MTRGLPPGAWSLRLDPGARRTDGGTVLVGGSPFRVLRLTDAGARWLDDVLAGGPIGTGGAHRRLARRLLDAAVAHPVPQGATPAPQHEERSDAGAGAEGDRAGGAGAGAGAARREVAVVIPVRHDDQGLARTTATLGRVAGVEVVRDDGPEPDGPGAARQRGVASTTAPLIAFVDAGVELPPGWLDALLPHFDDPAVGAVAPRVAARRDAAPVWLAAYEARRSPLDLGPVAATVRPGSRVSYVPTAVLVVRRTAFEEAGGFDTSMHVGEDVDLIWRLHRAGWTVRYEPGVVATHPCRSTLAAWLRQRFRYGSSAAALAARHGLAVAPLQISGWSAAAWGAVVAGHPLAGAAVAAGTTAAMVPKLRHLERPAVEALRIAGLGNLWAGRAVADALRRPWWPFVVALALVRRRSRPALAAALVVPSVLDRTSPALRLLDDLAYGAGVWAGCLRARSLAALRPAFTGKVRVGD